MLQGVNYRIGNKTIYVCDRCNNEMEVQDRRGIYVTNGNGQPRKTWDLCKRCYAALDRGIKKGVQK